MIRRLLVAPLLVALLVAACGSESPSPSGGTTRTSAPASGAPGPTPTPSPIAAGAGAFGEFEPIVLKGKGNKTVEFEIPEDAISLAAMSHPGKGAFQVQALGEDGTVTQSLVKTSGKYSGVVLFDLLDHSVAFKVTAKGPWKITVQPTELGTAWDGTGTLKGKGDAVVLLSPPSEADATLDVRSSSKNRFTIRAHSADEEVYLVNQKGPFKGRLKLPEETLMLEIRAKGNWTLTAAG
jgi:hypothetical protein